MSSKKAEANRRNAQKSTGPKDTSKTRFNAIKHGLLSESVNVYDAEILQPILERLRVELQPKTAVEDMYVDRIALYMTRLQRAASLSGEFMRAVNATRVQELPPQSKLLDCAKYGATGEVPARSKTLAALHAAVADLPAALEALFSGPDTSSTAAAVAAMERFSAAIESLPHNERSASDVVRIVEMQEKTFQRYETHLENRLMKLLNEYERSKRLSSGEDIPAPVSVNVTMHAGTE
jgi:hypothetical protein